MSQNLFYSYGMPRSQLGKQPMFSYSSTVMLDTIDPNPVLQKIYGLRNPVNQYAQATLPQSENELNTKNVAYKTRGMNHAEGGWPKEIHFDNEEETVRYRRRIEREETYVDAVMRLYPRFEHFIKQNNAIEVYEQYFKNMEEMPVDTIPIVKVVNVYRDEHKRPVSDMAFTNEDDPKLVVAYCSKKYPIRGPVNNIFHCFVWELDNPDKPVAELIPPAACWCVACAPVDPAVIVGGLEDGRVCVFDQRHNHQPVTLSPPHIAHRAPVTALLYIQSRFNNEFFTGSSDGKCIWYDIRNLSQPIDYLIMSVNVPRGESISLANAEGIYSLQFDRTLPTRFLAGTDTGLILSVNRKGKTHDDIMSGVFKAHAGPVKAVHRSPCTSKMLLSCGDWSVNIWSEDIKTSPIITGITHRYQILDAVWAPERVSSYMTVSQDGKFRYWDLLRRYTKPILSMPVSKRPLSRIVPQRGGRFIALGGESGTVYMLLLSQDLVSSGPKDKPLMLQLYERESRREQILTTRMKEIRLKFKTEETSAPPTEEAYHEEAAVRVAEEEYRRNVIDEIRRAGIPPPGEFASLYMRKR